MFIVPMQLWKKSGSWLNNTMPDFDNFTIPVENLEEIQQKVSFNLVRHLVWHLCLGMASEPSVLPIF